jgi:hypothetical protein
MEKHTGVSLECYGTGRWRKDDESDKDGSHGHEVGSKATSERGVVPT